MSDSLLVPFFRKKILYYLEYEYDILHNIFAKISRFLIFKISFKDLHILSVYVYIYILILSLNTLFHLMLF